MRALEIISGHEIYNLPYLLTNSNWKPTKIAFNIKIQSILLCVDHLSVEYKNCCKTFDVYLLVAMYFDREKFNQNKCNLQTIQPIK